MASSQPPPSAKPFTAAITGFGSVSSARNTVWPRRARHFAPAGVIFFQLGDVRAGDERPAGPREDDAPHVLPTADLLDRPRELDERRVVQRVELVGTVDRDRGDALGDVEGQEFVGHAGDR